MSLGVEERHSEVALRPELLQQLEGRKGSLHTLGTEHRRAPGDHLLTRRARQGVGQGVGEVLAGPDGSGSHHGARELGDHRVAGLESRCQVAGQRSKKGFSEGACRTFHDRLQPLLRPPLVGDVDRHAEDRRQLRIGQGERNLRRLEIPDVALGVGDGFFLDHLRATLENLSVVATELFYFLGCRGKVGIGPPDELLYRGAVDLGRRLVGENESSVQVFGEDEVRDQIDDLAQPSFTPGQRLGSPLPFELGGSARREHFEQGEVGGSIPEGTIVEHDQVSDVRMRRTDHRYRGVALGLEVDQILVVGKELLDALTVDRTLPVEEHLLTRGCEHFVFEVLGEGVSRPEGESTDSTRRLSQTLGDEAIADLEGTGDAAGQRSKEIRTSGVSRVLDNGFEDLCFLGMQCFSRRMDLRRPCSWQR